MTTVWKKWSTMRTAMVGIYLNAIYLNATADIFLLQTHGIETSRREKHKKLTGMITMGGCSSVQLVDTKNKSLLGYPLEQPSVLFYSSNPNYPLINFIFADSSQNIYAIQATRSLEHSCLIDDVRQLVDEARVYKRESTRGFLCYFETFFDNFRLTTKDWQGVTEAISVFLREYSKTATVVIDYFLCKKRCHLINFTDIIIYQKVVDDTFRGFFVRENEFSRGY